MGKKKLTDVQKPYVRPSGAEIRARYLSFEKETLEDLEGLYGTSAEEMYDVMQHPERYNDEQLEQILYGRR